MRILIRKSLLILSAGAFGLATADAELVAHWPLDTDATDATGNGHDGSVVGGTVTFGEAGANASTGTSAAFPDNGHIDVPFDAALNPTGDFTVALWANADSTAGFASPITSRDDVGGGTSTHGYILYNNNGGNWDFWTGDGDPGWDGLAGDPVAINTWTHVAITYDSATDTKTLWIDGAVSVSDNVPQSGPTQYSPNGTVESENLHIGAGQDDGLNFYFSGNIDDVGIWDEALTEAEIQSVMNDGIGTGGADPNLRAPGLLELTYDGVDGSFNIPINNTGATQDLNIIGTPVVGGADAANFLVAVVPGPIAPGGSANLEATFDPMGAAGVFEATFDIESDDSLMPNTIVTVRMTFHDPFVSGPTTIDFGTRSSSSGSETVNVSLENLGMSTLNIADITLGGPDAANFSLGAFANIPGGGMTDVELTFSPNGAEGSFSAELVIESDDPITPTLTIPIVARVEFSNPLIAHWPLDVDASDASGNGFDGTVVGGTVNFGQPGANAATGASASFPDNGHIDIPFDAALNPGEKGPGLSGSFTIALWANSSDNANFNSPFTSREDSGTVNGPIIYNNPSGNWSYWAGNNGPPGAWNAIDDGAVPLNTWQHVAVTYEASTMTRKMYVDGVEVINQVTGVSANSQRDTHIGAGQDDGNNFFWNGLIDDVGLFRVALTDEQILAVMNNGVASFNKTSKLPFSVEAAPGDMLTLRWDSQGGKLYNLRSVTDPSVPIAPSDQPPAPLEWPIYAGNADLAATAPENVLTIPRPADPERYFLIEEFNAPPMSVFSDDFEAGQGSWTTGVDDVLAGDTFWEFGAPSVVGPATANSGVNCFGTNLAATYDVDADIWLRSPEIDLTTAGGATLNYASWRDIELMFDKGTVSVLNAVDDSVLAVVQADIEGSSAGWEQVSVPIPAAALGSVIKLEFRFESDNFQNFIGWYVDDVVVTVP